MEVPKEVDEDKRRGCAWAKDFIKERVGVDCNVVGWRISGKVIVITVEDEAQKREIMTNKHKLRGGTIYIET
jgi:hypothetical protein